MSWVEAPEPGAFQCPEVGDIGYRERYNSRYPDIAVDEASLINIPDAESSLVLRTDYADDVAWETVCAAIKAPVRTPAGEFRAYVAFLSDKRYQGLQPDQVLKLLPGDYGCSFIFVVDEIALRNPEHPVLVLDVGDKGGRPFRVIPSEMWCVENNLSLANMDFSEFAENVDADGVFRGF